MISEFEIIKKYFTPKTSSALLGVGDDCALIKLPQHNVLATSTDTLIQGIHFFSDTDPYNLGHKSLAVNLSDLAAMGAKPMACLLNLALPEVNSDWLERFSKGFFDLSNSVNCDLVGGDTTRSNNKINITVTVMGAVNADMAMKRSTVQSGDDIWVTGNLGAPHVALLILQNKIPDKHGLLNQLLPFLEKPTPPNDFAMDICGFANAAIDISDGFMQDLEHILNASNCAAKIIYEQLPIHHGLKGLPIDIQQQAVLSGGDVYQLCFTASPKHQAQILKLAKQHNIQATKVGNICAGSKLDIIMPNNTKLDLDSFGYDHFK